MTSLKAVEGIGEQYAAKLAAAGVRSAEDLLRKGASARGRADLAEAAGVSPRLLLEWVNHVDLFRIKGVGPEYADLLEEAGVDTVPELAQRRADNLVRAMRETGTAKRLVRRLPALSQVEAWIAQAKALPRIIEY